MKTVSIIRDRGQLTIPDSIRKRIKWVGPMSAVSVTLVKPDEIVIKPNSAHIEWDEVWSSIDKARKISASANSLPASEFLQADRASH